MKARILIGSLLVVGLLGDLPTPVEAADEKENEASDEEEAKDAPFVYDPKSGLFVRARRSERPPHYKAGDLNVNVGYEPRVDKAQDAWPYNVERFLFKRPLQ